MSIILLLCQTFRENDHLQNHGVTQAQNLCACWIYNNFYWYSSNPSDFLKNAAKQDKILWDNNPPILYMCQEMTKNSTRDRNTPSMWLNLSSVELNPSILKKNLRRTSLVIVAAPDRMCCTLVRMAWFKFRYHYATYYSKPHIHSLW